MASKPLVHLPMKKKAQMVLGNVPNLVITFGIVAIVLGIMALILTNLKGTSTMTGTGSRDDSNLVVFPNGTSTLYGDKDNKANLPVSCSAVSVYNGSADTDYENVTAQFLTIGSTCYATLSNNSFNGATMQVNYTLVETTYTYSYNITEEGEKAQNQLSSWQVTWAIIVASAIVLGVIGTYLLFRR